MSELLKRLRARDAYPREQVSEVMEFLTSGDPSETQQRSADFFTHVVEPLCDSFSPTDVAIYNALFSQLIHESRTTTIAARLSQELDSFGVTTEDQLQSRADWAHDSRKSLAGAARTKTANPITRCIVLSRVTLGADVAITSVIIDRLAGLYPGADIVLLGSGKLRDLFGGDRRISFAEIPYQQSDLIRRLAGWTDVLDGIRELSRGAEDEVLIVDPDSRLTQLGVLPVTSTSRCLFFPSRTYGFGTRLSLARLTSEWLDQVTGENRPTSPFVRPQEIDLRRSADLIAGMRMRRDLKVVTVNFGVGNNNSKRVGDDFETDLVRALVKRGLLVILDSGASPEERSRAAQVVARARDVFGETVAIHAEEKNLDDLLGLGNRDCRLLTWSGRVGMLAGLIASSDLYIGYDSAGQHIAAALGVPCIDVFAGAPSERFRDRWTPTGAVECTIVATESKTTREILDGTLHAVHNALERR